MFRLIHRLSLLPNLNRTSDRDLVFELCPPGKKHGKNNTTLEEVFNNITQLLLSAVAFKVPKSDAETSRFVLDGQDFNELLSLVLQFFNKRLPKMPPITIRRVVQQVLNGWKYMSTNDFKSFFFQFEIHSSLGNFLVVVTESTSNSGNRQRRYYKMRVLPMGITFAPALAQHVALFIRQLLRRRCPDLDFDLVVWIDNILLLSNDKEIDKKLRSEIDSILAELGIVAKGWETPQAVSKGTALGMDIDLVLQSIRPSKKSLEKLTSAHALLLKEPTPRNFFTFHGSVMWICYLASIPLAFVPDFMELIRAESKWIFSQSNSSSSDLWSTRRLTLTTPTALRVYDSVLTLCIRAHVSGRQSIPPPLIAGHTDASTEALAGISLDNRFLFTIVLAIRQEDIALSELFAGALFSIQLRLFFGDISPRLPWLWITDNTTAKFAMLKGHSSSTWAESILKFWYNYGILPSYVMWVPTSCMRADTFTRRSLFTNDYSTLKQCKMDCPSCNASHEVASVPNWNVSLFSTEDVK